MRVVFLGTPHFAVPSLEEMQKEQEILAVVTQPDRRRGRGQKYSFSPVKSKALEYGLPVWQPQRISTPAFLDQLEALEAQVFVVVAFGQKIPSRLLEMAPWGCLNVHPSLLPKYRGAAPIQAAIINGEKVSGVTTMHLSSEWDAGDIILQVEEEIRPRDTAGTLHDRLSRKGALLLGETLRRLEANTAPRRPQDHHLATFAPKLSKEDAYLDFRRPAQELDRLIRGLNPRPGAYTFIKGEQVKIWQALPLAQSGPPGRILAGEESGLVVGCARGSLLLQKVQRPNSRIISGLDLANGLRLPLGECLI